MIRAERRESVAWVILDRPERRNAITRSMIDELDGLLVEELEEYARAHSPLEP